MILFHANTYLSIIIYSIVVLTQHIRTLIGDYRFNKPNESYSSNFLCQLNLMFVYSLLNNILLSVITQALYHMFNIKRFIRSEYYVSNDYKYFSLIIIFQWIIGFIFQLPNILISNQYTYEVTQFNCIISYSNIKACIYNFLVLYILPCGILIGIYYYSVIISRRFHDRHFHHFGGNSSAIRFSQQCRDIVFVKRIVLSVIVLISMEIPTIILMVYYIITGNIISIGYRLQSLNVAVSIASFSLISFIISPPLIQLLSGSLKRKRENETEIFMQRFTGI